MVISNVFYLFFFQEKHNMCRVEEVEVFPSKPRKLPHSLNHVTLNGGPARRVKGAYKPVQPRSVLFGHL
jgi:hypothetical protein